MIKRRRSQHRHVAPILALLTFGAGLQPLSAQYRFDVWTADNGLPQNVIRGIQQTADGYLWIATFDGLARFDGVSFTLFNKSTTPDIHSNRFSSMYKDAQGDLWLTTEASGVTRFHQGHFETYGVEQGVAENVVRGITGDPGGRVWILEENDIAIYDVAANRFRSLPRSSRMERFYPLEWGDGAGFWSATSTALRCFLSGREVVFPLPQRFQQDFIWGAALEQSGSLLIETTDGEHFRIGKEGSISGPLGKEVLSSYIDRHGHPWSVRIGLRLTRSLKQDADEGMGFIEFRSLFEDREQNLWLGSQGQGLFRFQQQSIKTLTKEQGLNDRDVYPIAEDHLGVIWIGAWHTGISRYADGHFTRLSVSSNHQRQLITAIAEDHNGALWVGAYDGVRVYRDGAFHLVSEPMLPDGALVQAIHEDKLGTLWFGTSRGLVGFRSGETRLLTKQDGMATDDVRVIEEASNGDLWIGGYGGLTRLRGDTKRCWREQDGLPSNNVRAIHVDEQGVVWIGTYDGGLGRLQNDKVIRITTREGLFNNGVFQILDDGMGSFWMSSNRGIYRVSKANLEQFANGTMRSVRSVAYGKSDGMLNVECNGGLSPPGIRSRDGMLWFPTQDGVAIVDPKTVRTNPSPPPVLIESATVDRVPVELRRVVDLPPGSNNIELHYTALSFIKSDQIPFKYRLEGLDSEWTDAGSRRLAYYSHLPPGSYTFHVIAANSDGVWNMQGQTLGIHVLAPFYRTGWFQTLTALCIALLVTWAWRYRVSRLERAHVAQQVFARQLIASQESERKRIAAELHDSLGQRLLVIKNLMAMVLRSRTGFDVNQAQTLEEISDETSLAISETREISYNLRPFQLDRLGLTKAIDALIRKTNAASDIRFERQLANVDDVAPEELRINLYRILQESLNNIVKHSSATYSRVRIDRSSELLTLTIEDNGRGFDPTVKSRPAGGTSGFGLTGMSERATLLGGVFKIRSAAGQGTVLTIELPIRRE